MDPARLPLHQHYPAELNSPTADEPIYQPLPTGPATTSDHLTTTIPVPDPAAPTSPPPPPAPTSGFDIIDPLDSGALTPSAQLSAAQQASRPRSPPLQATNQDPTTSTDQAGIPPTPPPTNPSAAQQQGSPTPTPHLEQPPAKPQAHPSGNTSPHDRHPGGHANPADTISTNTISSHTTSPKTAPIPEQSPDAAHTPPHPPPATQPTEPTPIATKRPTPPGTPTKASPQAGTDHATLRSYYDASPASIESHILNTRIYSDGMPARYTQPLLPALIAIVSLTLYTAWIHILYFGTLAAILTRHLPTLAFFLAIWATVLLPARPIPSSKFLNLPIWRTWRQYFHFSFVTEVMLDPKDNFVFAEFPHGSFPLAPLIAGTLIHEVLPELKIYGMAASSLFSVPGYRHFIAWMGSDHATRENFHKYLKKGSVALVPGGIAEMYYQYPDREVVKLNGRKGFVRVAVSEGKPIVPVYHFGNTRLLDFGPKRWEWIGRKLRVAFGLTYGRWGLPVPRRLPLMMVVGPPVEVPRVARGDPGFEAAVEEVHGRVVDALQGLYDRHKEQYGWGDRPLVVV